MNSKMARLATALCVLPLFAVPLLTRPRIGGAAPLPPSWPSTIRSSLPVLRETTVPDAAPRPAASATPAARAVPPAQRTAATNVSRPANALVVLEATDVPRMQQAITAIEGRGGAIVHIFPTHVAIGYVPEEADASLVGQWGISLIARGTVDPATVARFGPVATMAVGAWNASLGRLAAAAAPVATAGPTPHPLDHDALVAPGPPSGPAALGAAPTYYQTSEYMIGQVAVGIIVPESIDGAENWSEPDINYPGWDRRQLVISGIQAGLGWWAAYEPHADLTFVYDIHLDVPTSYEAIGLSLSDQGLWINQAMAGIGYSTPSSYFDRLHQYNNDLRQTYDTDWAFTIFVVDSLSDVDGMFANGYYFAYAYLGGPFMVMTYDNDGWQIWQMNIVTAHEAGHIFLALDEYTGAQQACTYRGGYLSVENQNSAYPQPGACTLNQDCVMRGSGPVCPYTAGQVGWRDSDVDGILDPADTVPALTIDPWPPELINANTLTYTGLAEDMPYDSPARSDVTINQITSVEFQVDYDGVWRSASAEDGAFDETVEAYALTTPALAEGGHAVLIQAVNSCGNASDWAYDTFAVDTVPPTCTIGAYPAYGDAPFLDFWVGWGGADATSGLDTFDVEYRDQAGGNWTAWFTQTSSGSARFVGEDTHTYNFRVRARDLAGNLGAYTDGSASYTVQTCPAAADAYEADGVCTSANWIGTNGITQTHNFHVAGDNDWFRFRAAPGVTYTLITENAGGHADTVLYLYATDGSTLIAVNDDDPANWPASRLEWLPTVDGVYYALVSHWDEYAYGCTTEYSLAIVTNDVAPPSSAVSPLPARSFVAFSVGWAGQDAGPGPAGTGIASFDVQYRDGPSGSWLTWLSGTTSLSATFNGTENHTYYFRSRARDRAGNVEDWPADPDGDAFTEVLVWHVWLPMLLRAD